MTKISVCIIVKNQENKIKKCLEALRKTGFGKDGALGEIIVTDTGSSDNTRLIAEKLADYVYDFEWINDFSAAKNYCISKSNYDYVLVIDSDEYMTAFDEKEVNTFICKGGNVIGRIKRANEIEASGMKSIQNDLTERLFNKNLFHFKGSIHEQVVPVNPISYSIEAVNIQIDHDGYLLSEDELREKAKRNNELLFKELKKKEDPYIYFQIGQSFLLCRDAKNALIYFEKGLAFDVDPANEYVQMMITGYGQCLLSEGENEKALNLQGIYDQMSFSPDFVFMMGQIYMANNLPIQAYKEFLKCLSMSGARGDGVTSFFPLHNIGVINEMLGETETAISFYQKAAKLGYKRSIDRLKELSS